MHIDRCQCRAYWLEFVKTLAPDDSRRSAKPDAFAFGGGGQIAHELAGLVLAGTKRATTSLPIEYTSLNQPLPVPGALSIILDGRNNPVGIIERIAVDSIPFGAVDAEYAALEGEGDRGLRHWREVHARYFNAVLAGFGGRLEASTPVLCQRFKLIWPTD